VKNRAVFEKENGFAHSVVWIKIAQRSDKAQRFSNPL